MTQRSGAEGIRSLLAERARKLALKHDLRRAAPVVGTFAIVGVGDLTLGLPVTGLREIVRAPAITPLAGLPPHLPGIAVVGGELLCAVDIGLLYGATETERTAFLAVLADEHGNLGILVDRVLGSREVHADELSTGGADPAATRGFPSRGTTRDLVILLDTPRFFRDERLVVDIDQPSGAESAGGESSV